MTGQRFGNYELIRKIAAGGMAEVFLARHYGAGGFFRDLVLKRLFRNFAEDSGVLGMFQDEARLLSLLSHPNVPQVYDVGFSDGHWYIAMEYVEGLTLADVWRLGARQGYGMPLNVAIGAIVQISEGLHHAHERSDRAGSPLRIVHRDVTPQNIMLTRDGVAKIVDFGIARSTAREEDTGGAARGTIGYMAPEQVLGRSLDKRVDVFALGIILYELTTGTRLYRGGEIETMTQVVEGQITPPSEHVVDYPPALEAIVMGALSKERADRIASAGHLSSYLEDYARAAGVLIHPRVLARHVREVAPAERVIEQDLSMVNRPRPLLEVISDSEPPSEPDPQEPWAEILADDDPLELARLVELPDPNQGPRYLPDPLAAASEEQSVELDELEELHELEELEEFDELEELYESDSSLVAETEDAYHDLDPAVEGLPHHVGIVSLSDDEGEAILDGFGSDADEHRPIVLLERTAEKTPESETGGTNTAFIDELERRLSVDE